MKGLTDDRLEFRSIARELRILIAPTWPVRVRRVKLPESVHGDCSLCMPTWKTPSPYFHIRVSAALSRDAQIYVLIHEWAHALSWGSESHRLPNHGPEWGIALSRIWQALLED
tara:strand:+ start:1501 stop:1839 length:339 start_codon:yes stop_codon:yes gene_type:complete